jgi:uncharacterized protein involved in cysteine biosynthesis
VVAWFAFTTVGFVLSGPFNEILSERLERILCPSDQRRETSLIGTLKQTGQGLISSLRLAARQILWTLICLPLLLLPLAGVVPLFLVTAHFTGLFCLEAALARVPLTEQQRQLARKRLRWPLLGLGTTLQLLLMLPGIGLLILPVGVCAGTWFYCCLDREALWRA